ncbi:MAG TPA: PIG-L family deacetylase, partial [Trueperaceae bacterium]|nr:PIG-L family deacetylase [Trueperaceae bacterium]
MHNKPKRSYSSFLRTVIVSLLALAIAAASAQSRTDARVPEQEKHRGIVELYEALTPLKSVASFMTVGAHPDDERSSQIALLSRGMGVRSITVTANRGEGGQNSIGTEYRQALGVLRSREMEQSSAAFNVELFFLSESFDDPIFDFRFSKSAVET